MKGGATVNMERLILQRVLGTPDEMAPANAFCSMGDKWYLVVPRTVTPSWPKPLPNLAKEVLIFGVGLSDSESGIYENILRKNLDVTKLHWFLNDIMNGLTFLGLILVKEPIPFQF